MHAFVLCTTARQPFACRQAPREGWYAQSEQVRTIDAMIDWLRELWKLREVFAADPVTAKLLAA